MGYNMKRGNSAVPFKELGSSPAKMHKPGHDNKEGELRINDTVSKTSPGEGWTKTKGTNIWAPPKPKMGRMMKESKKLVKKKRTITDETRMKAPYKKPVGPRATKKNIKGETHNEAAVRTEGPQKLQTVRRKGLVPNSQKFSDKAFLKSQNESEVKRSDLDAKGKKLWDSKKKLKK